MMKKNDTSLINLSSILSIAALIAVLAFIIRFIVKACKAGRWAELIISTTILIGVYYILFSLHFPRTLMLWVLLIPIAFYAVYWCILFSFEKVTSARANANWSNRDWWWTLDGWEFEEEVARVFRLNGYKAKVTKKTGDGGVDIIMYKGRKKIIVQCKHYADPIPVSVARELNGLRDDFGADELMIVASAGVKDSVRSFISNKPYFKLLDLEDVIRLGLRPSQAS